MGASPGRCARRCALSCSLFFPHFSDCLQFLPPLSPLGSAPFLPSTYVPSAASSQLLTRTGPFLPSSTRSFKINFQQHMSDQTLLCSATSLAPYCPGHRGPGPPGNIQGSLGSPPSPPVYSHPHPRPPCLQLSSHTHCSCLSGGPRASPPLGLCPSVCTALPPFSFCQTLALLQDPHMGPVNHSTCRPPLRAPPALATAAPPTPML